MALENTTETKETAKTSEVEGKANDNFVKFCKRHLLRANNHDFHEVYVEFSEEKHPIEELYEGIGLAINQYGDGLAQKIVDYEPFRKLDIDELWLKVHGFPDNHELSNKRQLKIL